MVPSLRTTQWQGAHPSPASFKASLTVTETNGAFFLTPRELPNRTDPYNDAGRTTDGATVERAASLLSPTGAGLAWHTGGILRPKRRRPRSNDSSANHPGVLPTDLTGPREETKKDEPTIELRYKDRLRLVGGT